MAGEQHERTVPSPRLPASQISGMSASQNEQSTLDLAQHVWSFRDLQKVHDMAYILIDTGLQADERGDLHMATTNYTEGLHLLDKALTVNCEQLSQCTTDYIDQTKLMQQKMYKTRQQIAFRLQTIQAERPDSYSQQAVAEPSSQSSCEEVVKDPPSLPLSYEDNELTILGECLMKREISSSNLANAEELFSVDGVRIFYITSEGHVSTPTCPASLHIIRFMNEPQTQGPNGEKAPVFLHVGDWVYPLIPGASSALHANYGAYIFPDMTESQSGAAVGLMIPETITLEERQRFEDIIRSSTLFGEQSPEPSPSEEIPLTPGADTVTTKKSGKQVEELPPDTADKISKGILATAEWIAQGIRKGAEKTGKLIRGESEKYQQKYKPSEQGHKIDPNVQKGVIYAREATHTSVKVTGYVVNKLGAVTVAIAKELAPPLRKVGTNILPQSMSRPSSQGKSTIDGVIEVAASGVKGVSTVYVELEAAANSLGRCLADETVHVVTHTYGEEAGCLTENMMCTTGNILMTAHNVNNLGVKAIAKRAAKETGKAVINDLNDSCTEEDYSAQSGSSGVN